MWQRENKKQRSSKFSQTSLILVSGDPQWAEALATLLAFHFFVCLFKEIAELEEAPSPSAGLKTEPGILVLKENGFSEIMLEGMHFNVIDLIRSSSTAAHWSI